jgi:hypothetical protein
MSQYVVHGTSRSAVWYAGYVTGYINVNSAGIPYEAPPFSSDSPPPDVRDDLRVAIEAWNTNEKLHSCVLEGKVIHDLLSLHWLCMEVVFFSLRYEEVK